MARKKKKKPAADASAEAGESGETPDAETVEPSASATDVVTRTLAPIHARHAHLHPSEVHLSLEPDGVGSADPAGSRAGSSADATPTRARDPEPASVEDVALELRTPEGDGETTTARGGVGDPSDDVSADARSDDSDAPRDEHGDDADDEDHGEDRVDRARRRTRRPPFAEITEEGVSEDARATMRASADSKNATAAESPSRTPRSSDTSGAFAAAIRSPAAFLKGLSFSARGDARGKGRSVETKKRDDDEKTSDDDGAAGEEKREPKGFARREKKRDKRRAKKARRRLKRLVHAANTMGSAVSAKEQTTTQLALCMQLGLTMCLRNQPSASSFAAVADAALAETDVAKILEVKASNVEDGSKLPSFRFVTHAPCRFERVRSAWGLSLRNYAESFALETTRKTADERRREPPATNAFSPARHAREFSAGSSEGAGAFSLTDEGERSEGDGFFDGVSDDDEPRAETSATPRAESDDPHGAFKNRDGDAVFQTEDAAFSGNVSAAELVSTDAEDSRAENTHKRAGAVALRPDVFLPSQTSLRAISSAAASGKSSSWFFCSKDSRFLVKTCSLKERDVLLDILGEYSKHAETHRGTSLLPQYYGLYTIEVGSRSAHFIIMNYWFATMHAISTRFDLKGSTKGRRASRKERAKGDAAVLKDLDFLESDVHVQNRMAEEVKAAIATDVAFMERNRLIDYSMMVGLHFHADAEPGGNRAVAAAGGDGAGATSAEENGVPPSPGHRRRRSGYGSFGGSSGGNTGGALAHFSDASPPPTPSGASYPRERDANDENEPGTDAAAGSDALDFAGPFAEPAADDTRLQFQLRALETPFGLAYLGIIDILTQYGAAKIAENLCFGALACGADISCQPPDVYARRFKRFIDAHVLKVAPTIDTASAIKTASATPETNAAGDDGTNE